jgi:hypothetical protein
MKTRLLIFAAVVVLAAVVAEAEILVIAVGGDAAPDGNGAFFNFEIPYMNALGQVVFVASLGDTIGGNSDNTGVFYGTGAPGSLAQIVRKGAASPDGNGNFATLDARSAPVINDAGQVAFIAGLSGTFGGGLDETAIFRSGGTPRALTTIVRQGLQLPGFPAGITVPNLRGGGVHLFAFNELGQVALSFVGFGIFRSAGGGLEEIVRTLQPIPGGTGMFTNFSAPALNDVGQVAFADGLQGIFRGDVPAIVGIARAGETSPDGNGTFAAPFFGAALNDAGDVAFYAMLAGTSGSASDNQGIFIRKGDTLLKVVRRGEPAPDGNGRFLALDTIDNVAINEAGQTAFLATLTATAGGTSDNMGLFRGDGTTLTQIARLGGRAPDGSSITSLGRPALNDAGQVAFLAGLTVNAGGPVPDGILLYDDQRGLLQAVRTGDPVAGNRIAIGSNIQFEPSTTFNGKKRSGLNEQGQIVFRFDLDDGRRGVAIANPLNDTPIPSPTTTQIPTATLTPSPTSQRPRCVGDCDHSNTVAVNELVVGVNIALSRAALSSCPDFDCNATGRVTVDCLVTAVNAALHGCPP